MSKLVFILITAAGWIVGIIYCIVTCVLALLGFLADPWKGRLLNKMHRVWGYGIARIGCTRIDVFGRENIPRNRSVVFFANHSSVFDIYILSGIIPIRCGYFSKREILFIPLLGLLMLFQGCVFVNRKKPRTALRSIEKAVRNLNRGISMIIFPEGTRSIDGTVHPFKSGSLRIPSRAGSPIVPVTLCGTGKIMKKGSILLYPRPVKVFFGKPVLPPPPSAGSREKKLFLETIRTEISNQKTAEK